MGNLIPTNIFTPTNIIIVAVIVVVVLLFARLRGRYHRRK